MSFQFGHQICERHKYKKRLTVVACLIFNHDSCIILPLQWLSVRYQVRIWHRGQANPKITKLVSHLTHMSVVGIGTSSVQIFSSTPCIPLPVKMPERLDVTIISPSKRHSIQLLTHIFCVLAKVAETSYIQFKHFL